MTLFVLSSIDDGDQREVRDGRSVSLDFPGKKRIELAAWSNDQKQILILSLSNEFSIVG